MGISELSDVIGEAAPGAISSGPPHRYRGKVLAVDASIFLHQFDSAMPDLYNRHGENISVLKGFFYRTAFMLENGIKPVYVFDGKPPHLKHRKNEAKGQRTSSSASTGVGAARDDPKDFLGPKVRKDLEEMLTHLGVPFIQAPSEAEATCAALVAAGVAWGTVTEDMDALPFGSTRLIRNLKATVKQEVKEYDLQKILTALKMNRYQFVDLCILLGCDYCETIRGIGRKKALSMIQKHGNIEGILRAVKSDCVPQDFPYQETRKLLLEPDVAVLGEDDLRWKEIDKENLIRFLCYEKFLKKKDVMKKLEKIRLGNAAPSKKKKRKLPAAPSNQPRIDNIFPNTKSRRTEQDAHQKTRPPKQ
uniref:Flap endonuclease 1 n=1 Tax=Leptobrachium leishanense TaxID=445787 RepID=A0A8C5QJZ8_9ANUR